MAYRRAAHNQFIQMLLAKQIIIPVSILIVLQRHGPTHGFASYCYGSNQVPLISSHIHSIKDSLSAEKAANEYEFVLRQMVKSRTVAVSEISDCPKFDLIILGMGPDGHVASLFPNHPAVDEKSDWITFLIDSPNPPPERITFTLPVINSAANVALVVTGDEKAEAVHMAIDNVGPNSAVLPARMVQPSNGKLVWFLDTAAASKLEAFQVAESNQPLT